ncbi:MAG: hypothetical protein IT158_19825 [Bryobacterales bacterium]|nr:hypothetical protein [Bryobacterales bacterium]
MRAISLLVLLACAGQGAQVIMSGSGSKPGAGSKPGVRFRYETRIEPELPGRKPAGFGGGGLVAGAGFHRYLTDGIAKKYFGYDLAIDPEPDNSFRVVFQPLSLSPERLGLAPANAWSQIPVPRLPAPLSVHSRDVIALDLLVHPGTGQKIVDYLFIDDDRAVVRLPSGPARDYRVEDVPITLGKVRLSVNGGQAVDTGSGSISGTAVFFDLPDRGRFILSLAPNEELGFRKAGEIRGDTMTIRWGSETYLLESDGPIAPGGGVFNLYVYHDPGWRPGGSWGASDQGLFFGASDARSLVRRGR